MIGSEAKDERAPELLTEGAGFGALLCDVAYHSSLKTA